MCSLHCVISCKLHGGNPISIRVTVQLSRRQTSGSRKSATDGNRKRFERKVTDELIHEGEHGSCTKCIREMEWRPVDIADRPFEPL